MNTNTVELSYLKKALKFLDKNKYLLTEKDIEELIVKFIKKKYFNKDINIDYKQMKGTISHIYRIRKANIRIIIEIDIEENKIIKIIIINIDFRGNTYK